MKTPTVINLMKEVPVVNVYKDEKEYVRHWERMRKKELINDVKALVCLYLVAALVWASAIWFCAWCIG